MDLHGRFSTMIGSMPQKTPEEALKFLDKYPLNIPVWPQLPKRSFKEAMIPQYSEGFPGIKIDEESKKVWIERDDTFVESMTEFYEKVIDGNIDAFSISEEYASGFHKFIDQFKSGNKAPILKGQITGPFTFGLGLNDNTGKPVWFDEQYKDIVLKGLTMKALWQIKKLKAYTDNVIIFMDEPILSALGTPAYMGIQDEEVVNCLNEIAEAVHKAGAKLGIHCCGNMDWGLLAKTSLDIIAFDAFYFGEKLALYPEEIKTFLSRGGILAWGLIPTSDAAKLYTETADNLKNKYDSLLKVFTDKGISKEDIVKSLLLTPSCGMGTLSAEESSIVLRLLKDVTDLIRAS